MLKAWPPACVTIGWGGTFEGMDPQEKIRSLSGTPAPSSPCLVPSFFLPRVPATMCGRPEATGLADRGWKL